MTNEIYVQMKKDISFGLWAYNHEKENLRTGDIVKVVERKETECYYGAYVIASDIPLCAHPRKINLDDAVQVNVEPVS